jgi:hypothetical protein
MNSPFRVPPPRALRFAIGIALIAATLGTSAARPDTIGAPDAGATKPTPSPARRAPLPDSPNGTCAYTTLSSGVTQVFVDPTNFQFTQANVFWSAVGVRPLPSDNWALAIYDTAGVDTSCVSDSLAYADRGIGEVDVVVGDFNHMDLKSYYARTIRQWGNDPGRIEWDDGPDLLLVNNYPTLRATGPNDVVECFDVRLTAGEKYSFTLASTGRARMKLYVFRNPAAAPHWNSLDGAEASVAATPEGAFVNYTAPATDWYGVVVVNENGESGQVRIEVNVCFTVSVLTNGTPQLASNSPTPFKFTQVENYWTAVGIRGANATQHWDLSVWQNYAVGGAEPCFTGPLASSGHGFGKVDFVALDYNNATLGSAYVRAWPAGATNTPGTVVWDAGSNEITVGAPALTQATGSSHVVRMWDVALEADHAYRVEVTAQSTTGGTRPDCRALLFRNHNGAAAYAAGRADADLATSSFAPYVAPASGRYGLAVVNDNGASGEYTIAVTEADVVGVPPVAGPGVFVTRLVGVRPNPVSFAAPARIEFELARPARIGFELVDVAGRVRGRLAPAAYGAGPTSTPWRLRDGVVTPGGAAAGVYFLRMIVDGHPVGAKRLVMLAGGGL